MLIKGRKYPQIGVSNKLRGGPDYYSRIGAIGGKARVPKGFAKMPKEKVSEAGTKGGQISRRGPVLNKSKWAYKMEKQF